MLAEPDGVEAEGVGAEGVDGLAHAEPQELVHHDVAVVVLLAPAAVVRQPGQGVREGLGGAPGLQTEGRREAEHVSADDTGSKRKVLRRFGPRCM